MARRRVVGGHRLSAEQSADRSAPGERAVQHGVLALAAAGGAGWLGWMLGWPWVIDINDPDFNPLVVLQAGLLGTVLWQGVLGWRWWARWRAFGAADLVIDGPTPVPLGTELRGRVVLARPVAPTGDWRLVLTCVDIHESQDTRDSATRPYRREAFPVWSTTVTVPAATDTARGVPVRIALPAGVGPKPVPALDRSRSQAYFRFSAQINIPGFRRIVTRNSPPVDRMWRLEVRAGTAGPEFRAEFAVPIAV